jgi:hypothetical protein
MNHLPHGMTANLILVSFAALITGATTPAGPLVRSPVAGTDDVSLPECSAEIAGITLRGP